MESNFILDPSRPAYAQSDVAGDPLERIFPVRQQWSAEQAVAASTGGILAAAAASATEEQVVTTFVAQPPCARTITATLTGTAADVKAASVVVEGLDVAGKHVVVTLPAFTENSLTGTESVEAIAVVTRVRKPAMNGAGVNIAIGWGNGLGLKRKLSVNSVSAAFLGAARQGTAPTVAVSTATLSANTVKLSTSLNGTPVEVHFVA